MQLSLFARLEEILTPAARRPRRPRAAPGWQLIDHSCRHCMGRLVEGHRPDGVGVVRCAECGSEEAGGHDALCWCGVEMPGHGRVFECFRNEAQTMSAPQEIMVRERAVGAS